MRDRAADTHYYGNIVVYNLPGNEISQYHRHCDHELGPCGPANTFTEQVPVDGDVSDLFRAYRAFWEVSGGSMQKELVLDFEDDIPMNSPTSGEDATVYDLWNYNFRSQLLNMLRPSGGPDLLTLSPADQIAARSLRQIVQSALGLTEGAIIHYVVRFKDGSSVRIDAKEDGSVEVTPASMVSPGGQGIPSITDLHSPTGAGDWERFREPSLEDFNRLIDRFRRAGVPVEEGHGRILTCRWNPENNQLHCRRV